MTDEKKCDCGADNPQSARYGHQHLAWCATKRVPMPSPESAAPQHVKHKTCGTEVVYQLGSAETRGKIYCPTCNVEVPKDELDDEGPFSVSTTTRKITRL